MTWICALVAFVALAAGGTGGFLAAAMLAGGRMADLVDQLASMERDFNATCEAPCPRCGERQ